MISMFAGNPDPIIKNWIDENVKSKGSWDFDLTKLTVKNQLKLSGSAPGYFMQFGEDDNTLIMCAYDGQFRKYHMTNGDITTLELVSQNTQQTYFKSFAFSDDGMTIVGSRQTYNTRLTKPISLTTPYDITQIPVAEDEYIISTAYNTGTEVLQFCENGTIALLHMGGLYLYTLSTPYDMSTATFHSMVNSADVVEDSNQYLVGARISPDGKILLTQQTNNGIMFRSTMSEPYSLAASNMTLKVQQGNLWTHMANFIVNSEAKKIYALNNNSSDYLYEIDVN